MFLRKFLVKSVLVVEVPFEGCAGVMSPFARVSE